MLSNLAALLLPLVPLLPARVEAVIAELQRPGCPGLFDRLAPHFQESTPREKWAPFCEAIARQGALRSAVEAGHERGFDLYHLTFDHAQRQLGIAFDDAGRISGIFDHPWDETTPVAQSRTRFRWPLDRPTLVFWGGADEASNGHHLGVPRQRRAMDLDVAGADGQTHRGDGHANGDYYAYGAEVHAAADGRVLVVVDGVPDNEPGVEDDTLVPGNVVAIEHAPGEIAHYCHLKPGSARVKPGDRVKAGQVIGHVGNSGNSTAPHLHFHVQTSTRMAEGVGVEAVFDGVCLRKGDASTPAPEYRAHKGDVVAPCGR